MIVNNIFSIPLLEHRLHEVNKIHIRDDHLSEGIKQDLLKKLNKFQELFQPLEGKLTFTTQVKAEIRTIDDTPI